ncbi:OHCU decarboxylase [Entomobacter blattae]|uniref:OHCU decarboxylase n=1 Tax=Entomobacter blattae TaxID=2762277 RepID=A0A7H1NU80_9PROT|nr:OHCU decarboxylase [Entomobacter blattae]
MFEHSPWVVESIAPFRHFTSAQDMLDALVQAMINAPEDKRQALILAHPELGEKIKHIPLTHASLAEQESAGLDQMSDHDYKIFHDLNTQYRERFTIPFIICVRNHNRDGIIHALNQRLLNNKETETIKALEEISMIAAHRLALHLNALHVSVPKNLPEHGFTLSTHVLNTADGKPAKGVILALWQDQKKIFEGVTNEDGRCPDLALQTGSLAFGVYQLVFYVGDYFITEGHKSATPPFLNRITIEFDTSASLIETSKTPHYHVPLLVSPYGYSTYRGS